MVFAQKQTKQQGPSIGTMKKGPPETSGKGETCANMGNSSLRSVTAEDHTTVSILLEGVFSHGFH